MQHQITKSHWASIASILLLSLHFPISRAATALPPSAALNHISTDTAGFRYRIVQADSPTPLTNTIDRAEKQLAGTLVDPATDLPFANVADLSDANADGYFIVPGVINYSTSRGGFAGNFSPDDQMPGLPGHTSDPNQTVANVAIEFLAYLDLKVGNYRLGVNAADGFSASVRDISGTSTLLAQSEAAGETLFDLSVTKNGFYPFRFVYVHGADEGSIEIFSVDTQSEDKILLNDPTDDRSIKAYAPTVGASIVSLQPETDAVAVSSTTSIEAVIFHNASNLDTNTIRLTLDSANVIATLSPANDTNYLRVFYQPVSPLGDGLHLATLVFGASSTELTTNQWSFNVGLPAEIRLSIAPNGNLLTVSWTGGGTLQQGPTITGPWTDVSGTSGSFSVNPIAAAAFYRVHRP